jgi:hypothetical protein
LVDLFNISSLSVNREKVNAAILPKKEIFARGTGKAAAVVL